MLRAHLKWREQLRLDHLKEEFESPVVCQKYYPHGMFGKDREFHPVWILATGNIDIRGLLLSVKKSDFLKFLILALEQDEEHMQRLSEKHCKLIHTHTVIVDLENFDIKDALWKPAFDLLIHYLRMYEGNYPESLEKAIVINAPRIFSMFYTMVKPFLSEETRKKVEIHGKSGWKEAIHKYIDPDEIPLHWGGNCVDDIDGSAKCLSKVCAGGKVDPSYYTLQGDGVSEHKDLKSKVIAKKGTFKIECEVDKPGSTIGYTFKTESHDIAFGITFQPIKHKIDVPDDTPVDLIPIERVNCHLIAEDGNLICLNKGKYTLIFDNSFSWYRSKKILFNVQVIPPEVPTKVKN